MNSELCIVLFPSLRHSTERLLFAPAAGFRILDSGALTSAGAGGWYWHSSPFAAGLHNGSQFGFNETEMYTTSSTLRSFGLSVRCVQHLHEVAV